MKARINDFKTELETLNVSSFEELRSKINNSLKKLNYYSIHNYSTELTIKETDQISMSLLQQSRVNEMNPYRTYGDGNCLFRAVSKALYNNENYHQELRFRCILELCLNFENYLNPENYSNDTLIELIATINPSSAYAFGTMEIMKHEIVRTSRLGSYASSLNFFGLANSLSINIQQIYPDREFRDPNLKSLLTQHVIPFTKSSVKDIFIMWTHFTDSALKLNWNPNHFTCCLKLTNQTVMVRYLIK